jgi:hypothetical protein
MRTAISAAIPTALPFQPQTPRPVAGQHHPSPHGSNPCSAMTGSSMPSSPSADRSLPLARLHARQQAATPDSAGRRVPPRFLLHLLPCGFMRIRNFGFLTNRRRASLLPVARRFSRYLCSTAPPAGDHPCSSTYWNCLVCGGSMHVVERLSAAQLLLRSPLLTHLYAA